MLQEPSMGILIRRGIYAGFQTLRRERSWGLSLGALFGVLLLVQLLLLILLGMQGLQSLLRSRADLRLEILEDATDQDIQALYTSLQQLPAVDKVLYITREQAYERIQKQDPQLIEFLEEFELGNPFPETMSVTLNSLDDYDEFMAFLSHPQWKRIVNPTFLSESTDQEKHVYELISITQAGRVVMVTILFLTAATVIFIVTELTRRRALVRADEMLIERLVGAHALSIVLPFWTEATILLLLSTVMSMGILVGALFLMPTVIPALNAGGILEPLYKEMMPLSIALFPTVAIAQLIAAPLLAGIGSWVGIRPQLQARGMIR